MLTPVLSLFTGSITKMDADAKTKGNYAGGENVGGSWTDKIMGMKSSQPADSGSQAEGVEEDEWVRRFSQYFTSCSSSVGVLWGEG